MRQDKDYASMTLSVPMKIGVPTVPNYIRLDGGPKSLTIDIKDLSLAQLEEIGREWLAALIELAHKRRSAAP
jgi:hypothetical protein